MVKGEVLIEREIRQLLEAGITEIVVVTGYMHEKYEYLKDKFGVKTVLARILTAITIFLRCMS